MYIMSVFRYDIIIYMTIKSKKHMYKYKQRRPLMMSRLKFVVVEIQPHNAIRIASNIPITSHSGNQSCSQPFCDIIIFSSLYLVKCVVMLATVSPLENNNGIDGLEMVMFSDDNLLESIDFDDLFAGMDMLPDLEIGGEDDFISRKQVLVTKTSDQAGKKLSQGKKKVKVDWTPELHRRFVEAVEQLGVDKAVPSRIREIMGIASLTRHNIASHLQKYRSHRKYVLAREAEAASWSQRRGGKRDMVAPITPTMGFPHYRPLHVWGHPSIDHRPLMPHIRHSPPYTHTHSHVWPPLASPPPTWHQRAPYFPQILPPQMRFPTSHLPVPGIPPPQAMYKIDLVPSTEQSCPQPPLDLHPSKESIDAAIGDILSQPCQPLPLGLKPPALDNVMVELQRQGIQKIPPI